MTRKEYLNSSRVPFHLKRNRQWEHYGTKPESQWQKMEKTVDLGKTCAGFIRDKNFKKIYRSDRINEYDNLIAKLDADVKSQKTASIKPAPSVKTSIKVDQQIADNKEKIPSTISGMN